MSCGCYLGMVFVRFLCALRVEGRTVVERVEFKVNAFMLYRTNERTKNEASSLR